MPLFPIWIPIIVSILAFLWIVILGRFLPGPFDDIAAFMIMIGVWLVYGVSKSAEILFSNIAAGNLTSILIAVTLVVAVFLYIKFRK